MLKALLLIAFLASARCNDLEQLVGQWTPVQVFPPQELDPACNGFSIGISKNTMKCGTEDVNPIEITASGATEANELIVLLATTPKEVEDALAVSCTDKEVPVEHYVFRKLSENYVMWYINSIGSNIAVLMAKEIPTEKQLEDYVKTIDGLTDTGKVMCTAEIKNSSGSTGVNTALSWFPGTKKV